METLAAEYIVCVIEAILTISFCIYVLKDRLVAGLRFLIPYTLLLAFAGSFVSMASMLFMASVLPWQIDYSMVNIPLWLGVGYFSIRYCTQERGSRILLIFLLAQQVSQLCRSVTFFIYGTWFPPLAEADFSWIDILGFGLPALLITPCLASLCRKLYQKLLLIDARSYKRLWLIPLFFVLLYFVQVILFPIYDFAMANAMKAMILLSAFVTYSQTVSAVTNAVKFAQEAQYRTQLAHQVDLQQARMEDLENHTEEIKRIRHDSRQHAAVLRGLLEKGAVEKALAYLDDYEDSMKAAVQPPLCENYVADTLCRRYETLAMQADIKTELNLQLPAKPGVAGSDLAVILGNLWENAVAAAVDAQGTHRFIHLKVRCDRKQLLIHMENGYSGMIYPQGDGFLSTKPGRQKAEGVGIASIRAVAMRYGGIADFQYTPDTFSASVLLYPETVPCSGG
ncbi:ATP-binding protein [Blautia schinkii]|nr:ATP-binding protein [Blautia schinkii]